MSPEVTIPSPREPPSFKKIQFIVVNTIMQIPKDVVAIIVDYAITHNWFFWPGNNWLGNYHETVTFLHAIIENVELSVSKPRIELRFNYW